MANKWQDYAAALGGRVETVRQETHDALALIWGELNHGQQKKILKNPAAAELLKRYGVIEGGDENADN